MTTSETLGDSGQAVHDELVVKTLRGKAIEMMRKEDIRISPEEEKTALGLFPRVSYSLPYVQGTY